MHINLSLFDDKYIPSKLHANEISETPRENAATKQIIYQSMTFHLFYDNIAKSGL